MRRSWTAIWLRPWSKKLGRRLRTGPLRGVLGELAFYLSLILLGVFVLSLVLITHVMVPRMGMEIPVEARPVLESELARGGGGWGRWIVGVVSLAAIGSGVFGLGYRLLYLGFSRERISAGIQRPLGLGPRSSTDGDVDSEQVSDIRPAVEDGEFADLPSVPPGKLINESPGERLRYRLATVSTGRLPVFGSAALALIWNSVCLVLLAVVISGFWFGRPRPILAMMLVPFAGVAIWALKSFLRQVRQVAGVGPTLVEISDHPLQPGGTYELFVAQMGRMRLKQLKVELVCEEESFFRQGTDVRSDHHVALCQQLLEIGSVRVDPQAPWEQQLRFELPPNVMHSFSANNNSVRWRLVVSGVARPWPSFCRSFPIIVHPPLMAPPSSPR